jgi:hypothetical protein
VSCRRENTHLRQASVVTLRRRPSRLHVIRPPLRIVTSSYEVTPQPERLSWCDGDTGNACNGGVHCFVNTSEEAPDAPVGLLDV